MFWQPTIDFEFGSFRIDASERQLLRDGEALRSALGERKRENQGRRAG